MKNIVTEGITGKRKGNFSFSTVRKNRRMRLKAVGGRGRKRAVWVSDLYNDLREEFERFSANMENKVKNTEPLLAIPMEKDQILTTKVSLHKLTGEF